MKYKPTKQNLIFNRANFLTILAVLGLFVIFRELLGNIIFPAIIRRTAGNSDVIINSLLFIFVMCSMIILILIYWINWDNNQMKSKITNYVSRLVCKDYYQDQKRIDVDGVVGSAVDGASDRRLEVDGSFIEGQLAVPKGERPKEALPKEQGTYIKGKFTGTRRIFFENGQLHEEIPYVDDLIDGTMRRFYPDGRIHQEKDYANGKLNGIYRAFDEEGAPFFEIEYKEDVQHGLDKIYYKNGGIQYEDTYVEGVKVRRKTFDENGTLKFVQDIRQT